MKRSLMVFVASSSLTLGGCAAMQGWADRNPDQANQVADTIEAAGDTGAVVASGLPFGFILAPIVAGAAALAARQLRRPRPEDEE